MYIYCYNFFSYKFVLHLREKKIGNRQSLLEILTLYTMGGLDKKGKGEKGVMIIYD